MTVREKGYAHWEGRLQDHRRSWWTVARLGLRLAFKKKGFRFLYAGAFVPALAFAIGVYISERISEFRFMMRGASQLIVVNPAFFRTYFTLDFLYFMIVILMVVGGAGLIADDLRYNALQLYFSRPLGKREYIAGKSVTLLILLLSLTAAPGFVFILLKVLFSGSFAFLAAYPWIVLSILGDSAVITVFFCLYTLWLSSLSRNRRYVAVLLFAVYFVSDVLFAVLYGQIKNPFVALVSIKANLQQVGAFFFRQKPPFDCPVGWSFLVLAVFAAGACLFLDRKIRGVEVVK